MLIATHPLGAGVYIPRRHAQIPVQMMDIRHGAAFHVRPAFVLAGGTFRQTILDPSNVDARTADTIHQRLARHAGAMPAGGRRTGSRPGNALGTEAGHVGTEELIRATVVSITWRRAITHTSLARCQASRIGGTLPGMITGSAKTSIPGAGTVVFETLVGGSTELAAFSLTPGTIGHPLTFRSAPESLFTRGVHGTSIALLRVAGGRTIALPPHGRVGSNTLFIVVPALHVRLAWFAKITTQAVMDHLALAVHGLPAHHSRPAIEIRITGGRAVRVRIFGTG